MPATGVWPLAAGAAFQRVMACLGVCKWFHSSSHLYGVFSELGGCAREAALECWQLKYRINISRYKSRSSFWSCHMIFINRWIIHQLLSGLNCCFQGQTLTLKPFKPTWMRSPQRAQEKKERKCSSTCNCSMWQQLAIRQRESRIKWKQNWFLPFEPMLPLF